MLRPPGYTKHAAAPPKKKIPAQKDTKEYDAEGSGGVLVSKKQRRTSAEVAAATLPSERTVKVRDSTRQKVQVAEEERKFQEAVSPQRFSVVGVFQ